MLACYFYNSRQKRAHGDTFSLEKQIQHATKNLLFLPLRHCDFQHFYVVSTKVWAGLFCQIFFRISNLIMAHHFCSWWVYFFCHFSVHSCQLRNGNILLLYLSFGARRMKVCWTYFVARFGAKKLPNTLSECEPKYLTNCARLRPP